MTSRGAGKKYLSLTVYDASGQTQASEILWEPTFLEGYVKVEVRGGEKSSKVTTHHQTVVDHNISWTEELRVEIPDGSRELRIMLCKDKPKSENEGSRRGTTTVIAACGIYVNDVLEAVPIDKYFELFKPGDAHSGLGGFVRIAMKAVTTAPARRTGRVTTPGPNGGMSTTMASRIQQHIAQYEQEQAEMGADEPKRNRRWLAWGLLGTAAAAVLAVQIVRK